jgi:hypothetical protein
MGLAKNHPIQYPQQRRVAAAIESVHARIIPSRPHMKLPQPPAGAKPASLKFLRPFSLTIATSVLLAVCTWIDMSNADYRPGSFAGGRTTSGWFVLGTPFLIGIALLMSLPFSFLARRTRPVIGWLCLLAVFIPLIVAAIVSTTPGARLHTALDIKLPADTRIERITQADSFNAGITISGICSATPQLVNQLVAARALKPTPSPDWLKKNLRDETFPDGGQAFSGDRMEIVYDPARSVLFFSRRLGPAHR